MNGSAVLNLQAAEYARLTGSAEFMALVTGVYDSVPENAKRPYVTIGEAVEVPDRSFGNEGREVTRTFHIYDKDGATLSGVAATGNKRALTILNKMIGVLESPSLAVTDYATVDYAYEFGQPMPAESDGNDAVYRHIVAVFRVTLEEA